MTQENMPTQRIMDQKQDLSTGRVGVTQGLSV